MSVGSKLKRPAKSEVTTVDRIFGPPPILPGEDASAYEELLARVSADVKPRDMIERISVRDVVYFTWEIFRWRAIKKAWISLEVAKRLPKQFAEFLRTSPEGSALTEDAISDGGKRLAVSWLTEDPVLHALLKAGGKETSVSMALCASGVFMDNLEKIEQLDRMIAVAERRRDAVLHQMDRRRAFARSLRAAIQKAEDADFEVIGPGKCARTINGGKQTS